MQDLRSTMKSSTVKQGRPVCDFPVWGHAFATFVFLRLTPKINYLRWKYLASQMEMSRAGPTEVKKIIT